MDAFLEVKVRPVYGDFRAVISWKVDPSLAGGVFTVEKSHDGVNSWTAIGQVEAKDVFVDEHLIAQGKLLEHYYRIKVNFKGRQAMSSSIGTFGTVSREEFGVARQIMELEYRAMRRFTKVLICKFKAFAPDCHLCVDPDTQQAVGTSLCLSCYGTKKEGGYEEPVVSYMRLMKNGPLTQENSQDGTGANTPNEPVARMLAFPALYQNDMIVHKEADRRYLVNSTEVTYVGGKIPVVAMVNMSLMTTNDVRYQFPV